ncbi:MAG: hypothetical protein M1834_007272 [Cirrosporium novae-zelandiae]|nr:MAG: hypothetical protein M1834_007272 [Cirrosporium novae-zelandiae]
MALFIIHTTTLFSPLTKSLLHNASLIIDPTTGLITDTYTRPSPSFPTPLPEGDIDLTGKFVMPGLVDAHTHIFLHSYDENPALPQKRDESFVERVIRSVSHCRTALLAGYTTYRDLGSESMQEADANVRDAINRGLMPGPRLFVATRVLASSGSYEPRTENAIGGTCLPAGAEVADGVEGVRAAVRRRVGHGADVVKVFADYRRRIMRCPPAQQHPYVPSVLFPPREPNPDYCVYSQEELDMVVREAGMAGAPVSAHACTLEGAMRAVKAGVTTVEHGYFVSGELLALMKEKGCILVPTLAIAEKLHARRFGEIMAQVKMAWETGVRLACGGDTGTYPHGENVRELELMIETGIPVLDVLEACTVGGWKACGGELSGYRFGWLEEGCKADIIALDEMPAVGNSALRKVDFVMKDARVWKRDGVPVGIV